MSDEERDHGSGGTLTRPWIVVGAGRLGRALGYAAGHLGVELRATWNRTEEAARETAKLVGPGEARSGALPDAMATIDWRGAVVWLTVVDDAVADVAATLAQAATTAELVLHTSGSRGVELFESAGLAPAAGSLHPLLAVTDPETAAARFDEAVWSVEGSRAAHEFATAYTAALGAPLVELSSGDRPLYHASAVAASNLVVALVDAALEMAEEAGLSREEARGMLLPLVQSTVENLGEQSTEAALSGPVQRGDEGTIERHLQALRHCGDDLEAIYRILTDRARRLVDDGDGGS